MVVRMVTTPRAFLLFLLVPVLVAGLVAQPVKDSPSSPSKGLARTASPPPTPSVGGALRFRHKAGKKFIGAVAGAAGAVMGGAMAMGGAMMGGMMGMGGGYPRSRNSEMIWDETPVGAGAGVLVVLVLVVVVVVVVLLLVPAVLVVRCWPCCCCCWW